MDVNLNKENMTTELTVLNNAALQEGGVGVDFNNKLFKLKPAVLTIVQPQSTIPGATKGALRIADTGDEFTEMYCALLSIPSEQRQWHIGERGELNRIPENLMCFSTDMIKPHAKAKKPQAVLCANCSRADWEPYRQYKEQNGKANKSLIPSCDAFYIAYLIDTVYQLPLKLYVRSKAKTTFEQGLQNVARTIAMAKAQKKNPNIFDVKFKLTTKLVQEGKYNFYVPVISEPKLITEAEKEVFGAMYLSFNNTKSQQQLQNEEADSIAESQTSIDNSVVTDSEYVETTNSDGEINL